MSLINKNQLRLASEAAANGGTTTSLVTTGEKYDWNNKASSPLIFTNVSASSWTSDNTYADYGYKCDLSCSGVTSSMYAYVTFSPTEADSGNYASICNTGSNVVTIYSKVNTSITIPSVIATGVAQ